MSVVYTNNFDAETVGTLPTGWTVTNGTWTVSTTNPVAGSTQCLRASTDAANNCVLYTGSAVTSGRFSYQFVANVASGVHGNQLAPLFRANAAATQGYAFYFDGTGVCGLYYKAGAGFTPLPVGSKGFKKVTCAQGDTMMAEVAMDGFRFEFRLWNVTAGQTRPVSPTVTSVDPSARYASGYCGVVCNYTGSDVNDGGLDNFIVYNDFTPSLAQPTQLIARTDSNIFYSPNGWYDDGTYRIAALPGAYMKFKFTGKTLGLSTGIISGANSIGGSTPAVNYKAIIDGVSYVANGIGENEFTFTDTLAAGTHTAEIHVESSAGARWTPSTGFPAVCAPVLGIRIENTATMSLAALRPNRSLHLGDSITEGTFTDGNTGTIPTLNSATGTYARHLARILDAEYGYIAHAGASYLAAASDGSPAFPSAWQYHYSGVSRLTGGLFTDMPDYITVNLGTNGTTNQSDVASFITALRAAAPSAKIAFLIPLGNGGTVGTTAAVNAAIAAGDTNLILVDVGAQVRQEAGLVANAVGDSGSYDGTHYNRKLHAAIGAIWGGKMTAAFMPRRFTLNVV